MARRINEEVWEQRRTWIEKQRVSGLPISRFCIENGLNVSNFHAWRRSLNATAHSKRRAELLVSNRASQPQQGVFVQVPLQHHASQVGSSALWVEVSLAGGMVVRVPASNLAALQLVLRAMNPAAEVAHD